MADHNLITRTALYVLRCNGMTAFPVETKVHIKNPIPLGRGLGSSGAAVVAGVMLGNEVGKLGLSKARLLDFCLMIGKTSVVSGRLYTHKIRASPRQRRSRSLRRFRRNLPQRTQQRRHGTKRNSPQRSAPRTSRRHRHRSRSTTTTHQHRTLHEVQMGTRTQSHSNHTAIRSIHRKSTRSSPRIIYTSRCSLQPSENSITTTRTGTVTSERRTDLSSDAG